MINPILGVHEVPHSRRLSELSASAAPINSPTQFIGTRWLSPGLYTFERDGEKFLLLRTKLGIVFPSLYTIRLIEPVCLVPPFHRKVFGILFVVFLVVFATATAIVATREASLLTAATGAFVVFLIILLFRMYALTERDIAFRGFQSLVSKPQK
ncbi:MAG: hypothetical protein VXW22_11535 [Pseudomonadota bacterium]|nr:hypothetical protein [Pseudomonadota bacterium]